jgi:opacity protein-like surface antigen
MSAGFASAAELYGEVNTSYIFSKIDDEKFNPLALEARVGVYLQKQVGLEAYYGSGLSDDTQVNIDLSINTVAGVNFRFESPEKKGMKIFILLGYGMSEWDVDRSGTSEPGKVDFDDFSYGGGLEWRVGKSENWFVNLRGQRFLNKDDLSLDTGSVGVRYAF